MKKVTIAILCLAVGALAIVGLTRSGIIDFTSSNSSKNDKMPTIKIANPKSVYYNEDLPQIQTQEGVNYHVSYSSTDLKVESATQPTASGSWMANVTTLANDEFKQTSMSFPFTYKQTNATTINTYFESKDDSWGGSSGTSIHTSAISGHLVEKDNYSYIEEAVVGNDSTIYSFYRISKYDFDAKRKFTIYAANDIVHYGAFSFWLTDNEDSYKEVTMEIMHNETIFATGLDPENYFETKKANSTNYCDGFMHRYDIQLFEDKVEFSIDKKIVHTITDNIPSITYCKVQFGLLIPTDPFWSGTPQPGDKDVTVRVSQFEMYDPSTGALVLD